MVQFLHPVSVGHMTSSYHMLLSDPFHIHLHCREIQQSYQAGYVVYAFRGVKWTKSTLSKPYVGSAAPFSKLGSPNLGLGLPQLIQLKRSRVDDANSAQ